MGICTSKVKDDHTSPDDVNVELNENDENVVFADTVRLVSTLMLRRLIGVLNGDNTYTQLAAMATGKDVTAFELVAHKAWYDFFRTVWDIKATHDVKDAARSFDAVLTAVESAPYKKPGPAIATKEPSFQALSSAVDAQRMLLDQAVSNCDSDNQAQKDQLQLWLKIFGVYDSSRPLSLMDNIERLCGQ